MFTRTLPKVPTGPEREQMTDETYCPPHDFEGGWATPLDASNHDDTVPAIYCRMCAEIRPLKLPADRTE